MTGVDSAELCTPGATSSSRASTTRRVERANREPQPENQEHQADRPRIPQLRPLSAAVVAQPRPHPRRSLTDANQEPRSQVGCVEPIILDLDTTDVEVYGRRKRAAAVDDGPAACANGAAPACEANGPG